MTTIYQWKLEQNFGRETFKIRKKEVEVKETAKQYRALNGGFVTYRRTLPKEHVEAISKEFSEPIYSSLNPSDGIALAQLKEWYREHTDKRIANLTAQIEKQKHLLEQVESLEAEND